MRRVVAGFVVWLAVALIVEVATATAAGIPTRHCGGKVAAARYGVRLVASDIRIRASIYNATTVQKPFDPSRTWLRRGSERPARVPHREAPPTAEQVHCARATGQGVQG